MQLLRKIGSFFWKISQVTRDSKASFEDFLRQLLSPGPHPTCTSPHKTKADTVWLIWESNPTMLIMRWGAEAHWDFFQYSNLLIKHYSQLHPKFCWVLISARNSAVYFSHITTTSNNSTRLSLLLFHKWEKWYLRKSSNLPKVTKLISYRTPLSLTCTPYCLALTRKDVTCLLFY